VGTDPSADPGAKTEGRLYAALLFPPFGIGINALNPRGSGGGSPRASHLAASVFFSSGLRSVGSSWSRLRVRSQAFLSYATAPLPIPS
jgi:hypothetical protein